MSEIERLNNWMQERDLTVSSLAAEIGMSYDGVYQVLHWRKRISPGFKLRFTERFGSDEAGRVFDKPQVPHPEPA